jgi:hypothetical protein
MIANQFDECFDDPDVIEACNDAGKAVALRIGDGLRGRKDPEVLAVLMRRTTPMVTIDGKLPRKHCAHIPNVNPGIITVGYSRYIDRSRESLKTLTTAMAARILQQFKDRCPVWHQLVVRNSVVEITHKEVIISHVEAGQLKFDKHIPYGDNERLLADLESALRINAQRYSLVLSAQGQLPIRPLSGPESASPGL